MKVIFTVLLSCVLLCLSQTCRSDEVSRVYLEELDLSQMMQGYSSPHVNKSCDNNKLSIGGREYKRGVGTHAVSSLSLNMENRGAFFFSGRNR